MKPKQTELQVLRTALLFGMGLLLWSEPAQALTMEYHTYNGYDAVSQALLSVSLIFSDARYKELITPILLGSITLTLLGAGLKALTNASKGFAFIPPLMPTLTGMLVYLGFVMPTGSIFLKDDVLNKTRMYDNLPIGMVAMLGTLNLASRQMIDIVETTVNPQASYLLSAGGIGFDLIKKIAGGSSLKLGDSQKQASLEKYMDDCLMFEMMRPGTTITMNAVHTTDDWMSILDKSVNPSVYTLIYTDTHPQGLQMTCLDAWSGAGGLKAYFSDPSTFEQTQKGICANAGLDPADPSQYQACKDIIDKHIQIAAGKNSGNMPSADYIRQAHMAKTLNQVLTSGPDGVAMSFTNRNVMNQGLANFLIAPEFVPILQSVLTAVCILMIPILVLFLPTAAFSKALSTLIGFFVFLSTWAVLDAMMNVFGVNLAVTYFTEVAANHTGFAGIMLTPDAAGKALGLFGTIRATSITLATIIAGVAGYRSGAVMASFNSQAMAPINQGASQAARLSTTEGLGSKQGELEQAWTNTTIANPRTNLNYGLEDRVKANVANRQEGYAAGGYKSQHMPTTTHQASEKVAMDQASFNAQEQAAQSHGQSLPEAQASLAKDQMDEKLHLKEQEDKVAQQTGHSDRNALKAEFQAGNLAKGMGSLQEDQRKADFLGYHNQADYGNFQQKGGQLSATQAKKLGAWATEGMQLSNFTVGQDGYLKQGQIKDQVDENNLEHYQTWAMSNALFADRSSEEAEQIASRIQPGMMINGTVDGDGHGDLDFNEAVKVKDTVAGSQTTSDKEIHTQEVREGVQYSGLYQAALNQDEKGMQRFTNTLWKGDELKEGALKHYVDSVADGVETSFHKTQGSSKSIGGGAYGQAGWGSGGFKIFGADLKGGVNTHADYNRTSGEQNNQLRTQMQAEAAELQKQYQEGGITQAQFNKKLTLWTEGTAGQAHDREVERGDSNGAGNAWKDVKESFDDVGQGAADRMNEKIDKAEE